MFVTDRSEGWVTWVVVERGETHIRYARVAAECVGRDGRGSPDPGR